MNGTKSVQAVLQLADGVVAEDCPAEEDIQRWVAAALAGANHVPEWPLLVTVRMVAEDESAALNSDYRGKQGATNVLAFPAAEPLIPAVAAAESGLERELGDLVVCQAVAAREAAEQGKTLTRHLTHLIVHGSLHLLGYDHLSDAEAEVMEGLEREILGELGLPDPYAAEGDAG